MPNEKNLISNSERTPKERRELAVKAGKASGEARRRKRDAQQAAKLILNLPVQGASEQTLESMGVDENDFTNMVALMARMYAKAMGQGDSGAARFLIDMTGGDERRNIEREHLKLERERLDFEKKKYEDERSRESVASDAVNEWIESVMEESTTHTHKEPLNDENKQE
mgnify:CR=1 FL=1